MSAALAENISKGNQPLRPDNAVLPRVNGVFRTHRHSVEGVSQGAVAGGVFGKIEEEFDNDAPGLVSLDFTDSFGQERSVEGETAVGFFSFMVDEDHRERVIQPGPVQRERAQED